MELGSPGLITAWLSPLAVLTARLDAVSSAAHWDRPADGREDAGVFGAARISAQAAAGAPEAGSVPRDHRPDPDTKIGSVALTAIHSA